MKVIKHLINGEIVSMGDPTQNVYNPSTGEVSKQVEIASKTTVDKAIKAAQEAFPAWRALYGNFCCCCSRFRDCR